MINNKFYIGQKKGEFNPNYYGSSIHVDRSINKHGKHNFKLEVIIYAEDEQKLNELEIQFIKEYREKFGIDALYNISDGGTSGWGSYNNPSKKPENREKLRLKMLGDKNPAKRQEVRDKIGYANAAKVRTPEQRKRVSIGMTGLKQTVEHIENVRKALTGRKLSQEHCKKMRIAMLGKKRGKYKMKNSIGRSENLKLAWIRRKDKFGPSGGAGRKQ